MEYSPDEITVSDPAYIVRKRLGEELGDTDSREEAIQNMEDMGSEVDNAIYTNIRSDYENEIGDVLGGMQGGGMAGGPMGGGKSSLLDRIQGNDGPGDEEMSEEEQKERMKKFMRVSALQIAYQAYPVFKSIAVN